MNILQVIIENGLSVRQIPEKKVSRFHYDDSYYRHLKESGKEVEIDIFKPDLSYFENPSFAVNAQKALEAFYKRFPDGRKLIVLTEYPEHGGYWMVKQVHDTSSRVQWSIKTDNLAKTLEESVLLWLHRRGSLKSK